MLERFANNEMQEVPFNIVDTLMFNGQNLMCEQLFEQNDWGGLAYDTMDEFVNTIIRHGCRRNNIVPTLQARFNNVSEQPFQECNRLTITQFCMTIYYDPNDVINTLVEEDDEFERRLNKKLNKDTKHKPKPKPFW